MKLTKREQRELMYILWDWRDSGDSIPNRTLSSLITKLERYTGMDYGEEVDKNNHRVL